LPHPFVSIALPVPTRREFTYRLPSGTPEEALVGRRVLVPFGPRRMTGVIVGVTDTPPPVEAKEVIRILDEEPLVGPALLDLTRWIAEYYVAPWGEALRAALPLGRLRTSRRFAIWCGEGEGSPAGAFDAAVDRAVQEARRLPVSLLARRMGDAKKTEAALKRLTRLCRVEVRSLLEKGPPPARRETWVEILPEGRLDGVEKTLRKNAVRQVECLFFLRQKGRAKKGQLTARFGKAPEALERKGLVRQVEEEVLRIADGSLPDGGICDPPLTPEQAAALEPVEAAIEAGRFEAHLLYGITGSGKTEVYLRAASAVRKRGRSVLVLVPEIALTPQTVGRFRRRFGSEVVVLHSALSAGERHDTWREIHRGTFPVVVGVRSALFAPLRNLGLIVVDEEHDGSYKQGESPRYHARDAAVVRARLERVPILLGSATPSVESFWNARSGKYVLSVLPKRIENRPLPQVQIVDLQLVPPKKRLGVLSPFLVERLGAVLDRGDQAMLFLNRRGYAPFLRCPDCGYVPRCDHCEVSFTLHRRRNVLRCHYCGTERNAPDACPSCGGGRITHRGVGTERVEEDLAVAFPAARVARMDADTTRRRDSARGILADFAAGKVNVLLGTQMIAKGHHFPGVSLVGVINADTALHLPDFRAAERTFQLLLQVAGRAGRGDREGEVVIQTFHPEHYCVRAAFRHDYHVFIEREMADREELHYPPFSRIISLTFRGKEEARVRRGAARFRLQLTSDRKVGSLCWEILGPAPAPIARIRDRFRWKVMIKGRTGRWGALREKLVAHLDAFSRSREGRGVEVIVDVDALDLL